jgi:hypothetical protein
VVVRNTNGKAPVMRTVVLRRCSGRDGEVEYTSETTPPYDWVHAEITDSTVRECSATSDPVGILLGKPSGIVVVDIDVQHSGSIDRFIERYDRNLAKTRIVATPGLE